MKRKKCPYCHVLFFPHPRVGKRARTCGNPACQKALKAENNVNWRRNNPDYFKNDYERVKQWFENHPGYLKQYRESHPEYVGKNRKAQRLKYRRKKLVFDIQALITTQLPNITEQLWNLPIVDIQDQIWSQPIEFTFLFSNLPCLDIQDQIDFSPCEGNNFLGSKQGGCHYGSQKAH